MSAIVKDKLAEGAAVVESELASFGEVLHEVIRRAGRLQVMGSQAADRAGISPGLIGSVLDYAGRMQADLGHAALMLQGVHAALHEAMERLDPTDPVPQVSGGKVPPPKP